jgi:hypothetical protein
MPYEEMINDSDVKGLRGFFLSGVLVGIGSLVLQFSGNAQIIISCPFKIEGEQGVEFGHGEDPYTSPLMFKCLNDNVVGSSVDDSHNLRLNFRGGTIMTLLPDHVGLESYVVCMGGQVVSVS